MTFSRTLMVRNRARFWNVRPMPSAAMPCGGVSSSDRPSKAIRPSLNAYRRDRQLNIVVLPAPFGPMKPTMWPAATENETRSSATMPPKRTDTFSTSSKGWTMARPRAGWLRMGAR